eukprot:gene20571-22595_t
MQNSETSRRQVASGNNRSIIQRVATNPSQGLIYPRQDNVGQNPIPKYPPLIIEDETKNYVDGLVGDDDIDSDGEPNSKRLCDNERQKKTRGRVKIKMEFIQNKLRRYTTFSKRKTGIMKKAYELSTLTGTQVMLLVASETGHVYTFATRKLQPMITSESGKALIQTCLNSPDPSPLLTQFPRENPSDQRMSQTGYEEPDLQYSAADDEVKLDILQPQVSEPPSGTMTGIQFTQGNQGIATYINPSNLNEEQPQSQQQPQANQATSKTASSQSVTLQTVPSGSVTAIIAPSASLPPVSTQTIHVQPQSVQPQIIQGQLQMHKLHPQNILLSGNVSSLPPGHIIVNPSQLSGQVVIANSAQVQSSSSNPPSTGSQTHENIIIVPGNGSELAGGTAVQMVYNTPNGLVYASPQSVIQSHGQSSGSETLTIHHPVAQTAGSFQIQQDSQPSTTTTVLQAT